MHPLQANAMELRRRLRTPVNGINSSELEIVPQWVIVRTRTKEADQRRREDLAAIRARADFERRAAYEAEIAAERERLKTVPQASAEDQEEPGPRLPRVDDIIREVCVRYGVTRTDLLSARRTAKVVLPRQIVMFIARQVTLLSLPQIGMRLGRKDHTTVLHGARKIERLVDSFPHLAAEIADIKKTLGVE
jgi:chromosomal replication initiation ATPase DnaA